MRNTLKRTLGLVLALTLLAALLVPAAFAAKSKPVTNPTKFKSETLTTYVGMKTTLSLVDSKGVAVKASDYKWKSSKKSVVSVSKTGVITAKKKGKATITATNKNNKKDKCKITVTVQRNIVDNLSTKPAVSSVDYGYIDIAIKSIEITAPGKVKVEYYVVWNNARRYRSSKLVFVQDWIGVKNTKTGNLMPLVDGKVKNIKVSMRGGSVKTVKVKYSGKKVGNTNINLKSNINNLYRDYRKVDGKIGYR